MKKLILNTALALFAIILICEKLPAQKSDKTSARIDLQYFNLAVNKRHLNIKVTTKINRKHTPVSGVYLNIYLNNISDNSLLGSITTNSQGLGTFVLPPEFYRSLDTISLFTFICTLTDHPQLKDKKKELEIQEIELKTELIDQDTLKWIRAIVLKKSDSLVLTPIEDVEIFFFVSRPFSLLPISEPMETDGEGKATILFPVDIPGDASGYVNAVVKIDDSDEYGTIEKRHTLKWGIPTKFDDKSLKRSLWAAGANAPIALFTLDKLFDFNFLGYYILYRLSIV